MPNHEIGIEGASRNNQQTIVAADELRDRLAEMDQRVRRLCREHPMAMLLGSVAAGFIIGRLVTRR